MCPSPLTVCLSSDKPAKLVICCDQHGQLAQNMTGFH